MFWSGPDDQIFISDQISDPDQNLVDIWIRIRYLVRNPGPTILTFQRIPMSFVLETSHPTILLNDNSPLYAMFQHRQLTMPRAHCVCTDIIARLRTMCSVWRHDERKRYWRSRRQVKMFVRRNDALYVAICNAYFLLKLLPPTRFWREMCFIRSDLERGLSGAFFFSLYSSKSAISQN